MAVSFFIGYKGYCLENGPDSPNEQRLVRLRGKKWNSTSLMLRDRLIYRGKMADNVEGNFIKSNRFPLLLYNFRGHVTNVTIKRLVKIFFFILLFFSNYFNSTR